MQHLLSPISNSVFYTYFKRSRLDLLLFFIRVPLVLIAHLLILGSYCISQDINAAKFKFSERTIKHPKVKAGEVLLINYVFENVGNTPLVINNIKVNCSCTQPTWPKEPVIPLATDTIRVTIDTKSMIGWQDRTLMVYSNSISSPEKIRFKVMVDNKTDK